jgi:ActR/RegA family two-component response regulator
MDDWEPDFLEPDSATLVGPTRAPKKPASALVVEDDPELAHRCAKTLDRLGIHAEIVWTREQAIDLLSRKDTPLAFAFVDRALRDGSGPALEAEAHRLRPATPLVVATGSIADVLVADDVVLCKPFTAEQFQAAFDAAVIDGETSDGLREAIEHVRNAPIADDVAVA